MPKQGWKGGLWVALIHHPAERQVEIWDAEPVNQIWLKGTIALKQISIAFGGAKPFRNAVLTANTQ